MIPGLNTESTDTSIKTHEPSCKNCLHDTKYSYTLKVTGVENLRLWDNFRPVLWVSHYKVKHYSNDTLGCSRVMWCIAVPRFTPHKLHKYFSLPKYDGWEERGCMWLLSAVLSLTVSRMPRRCNKLCLQQQREWPSSFKWYESWRLSDWIF